MYAFDYVRPTTLEEAIHILRTDVEPSLLAGGQTLLPAMKHRLTAHSTLIDLQGIPGLNRIAVDGDDLVVGAMTRHADVANSIEVEAHVPALAVLAAGIGDPLVRNMGTIGGSIANNDPAADYPGAVLALNAVVETDRRRISADDFFVGMFETALEPDEVLVSVRFSVPRRAGYYKFPNPASGYVVVGAFVADFGDHVRVAINGAASCVYREASFEAALAEAFASDSLAELSVPSDALNDDPIASAAYRAHLVPRVAQRAVTRAAA